MANVSFVENRKKAEIVPAPTGETILPCPWCSSEAQVDTKAADSQVQCVAVYGCGAAGPSTKRGQAAAIKLWNSKLKR